MDSCMGVAVMDIIGRFLQFLRHFLLVLFLRFFRCHTVQDTEKVAGGFLITGTQILVVISDARIVSF